MKTLRFSYILLTLTATASAISIRTPGAIVGDPSTITQDRFEANTPGAVLNPDFQFSSLNFSGVGWDTASPSRTVTLISDRHFVAARHHAISSNVSFLTSSGVVSYSVASQTIINNPPGGMGAPTGVSDLRIGTLTAPIDLGSAGINFFPILDPTHSPLGQDVLIYGQNGRIGESTIAAKQALTVSGIQGYTNISTYEIASGAANDAYLTGGDSGGPSFLINGSNQLVLTGVHWAVGSNASTGVPPTERYNIDTDLATYITQAESQISGLTVTTATPEPSSTLLLLSATFGFLFRRNR